MSLHMIVKENQEKLQKVENTAFNYFMNVKSNQLKQNSNMHRLGKQEALKVMKEYNSI